jgi:hypothetical protein
MFLDLMCLTMLLIWLLARVCATAGLPHNDIAAQICRQAGLVKHEGRAGAHGWRCVGLVLGMGSNSSESGGLVGFRVVCCGAGQCGQHWRISCIVPCCNSSNNILSHVFEQVIFSSVFRASAFGYVRCFETVAASSLAMMFIALIACFMLLIVTATAAAASRSRSRRPDRS